MHKFPGTLTVTEIHGKRGAFLVGTLATSIGDFKVKDVELDQFDPGIYNGHFVVERIFSKSAPWKNGIFTEIIAKIAPDGFLIDTEDIGTVETDLPATQAEPDPIDESCKARLPACPPPVETVRALESADVVSSQPVKQATPQAVQVAQSKPRPSPEPTAQDGDRDDEDEALFGVELFAQFVRRENDIALDPNVDREQFRHQRDRLKAVGYRFDSKSQRWSLPA